MPRDDSPGDVKAPSLLERKKAKDATTNMFSKTRIIIIKAHYCLGKNVLYLKIVNRLQKITYL